MSLKLTSRHQQKVKFFKTIVTSLSLKLSKSDQLMSWSKANSLYFLNIFRIIESLIISISSANMNIKENEMQTNVQIEHTGKISLFRLVHVWSRENQNQNLNLNQNSRFWIQNSESRLQNPKFQGHHNRHHLRLTNGKVPLWSGTDNKKW